MSMHLFRESPGLAPHALAWGLANSPAMAAPSDPVSPLPGKGEKQNHNEITPQSPQGTLLALGRDSHPRPDQVKGQ